MHSAGLKDWLVGCVPVQNEFTNKNFSGRLRFRRILYVVVHEWEIRKRDNKPPPLILTLSYYLKNTVAMLESSLFTWLCKRMTKRHLAVLNM